MRTRFILLLCSSLMLAACGRFASSSAPPTFTPAPSTPPAAGRVPAGHPVVTPSCLGGLSSYRFSGTFSLQQTPNPASAASGTDSGLPAGSLANLVSHVSFQGEAQAPDRYEAQITFGGSNVQPLEIRRIGAARYSRFGSQDWTPGDALSQFGPLAQLDPESFCTAFLSTLDVPAQVPVPETVNGVPSLKYEIDDAPIARGSSEARATAVASQSPAARAPTKLTVWTAVKGGFPVRIQVANDGQPSFALNVDVTDLNGKDVRIASPK